MGGNKNDGKKEIISLLCINFFFYPSILLYLFIYYILSLSPFLLSFLGKWSKYEETEICNAIKI